VFILLSKNLGHRLGASGTKLENTLQAIEGTIQHVNKSDFKYWEFDVQETADGVLIVFHDDCISYDTSEICIKEIQYEEMVDYSKKLGIRIPKFSEVYNILKVRNEPVMIEIKNLFSERAREEIFSSLVNRENWKLMATPMRFLESFPEDIRPRWRQYANQNDIHFVRVGRHNIDLFKSEQSRFGWMFAKPKWLFGF